MPAHTPSLTPDTWQHQFAMEGATTLLSSNTHFAITSNDFLAQPYTHDSTGSTRKRKPIVTYQSPGSGVVDVGLLVRNTALEFEAAAVAAAIRGSSASVPVPVPAPAPSTPSTNVTDTATSETTSSSLTPESTPHTTRTHRPMTIPRPPRPLYHPLARRGTSRPTPKTGTSTESVAAQLAAPPMETGRRSSSRTRRPAPKVRDTEGVAGVGRAAGEKVSPVRRRRGAAAGKRKRGVAQQEMDVDGTYPAAKRTRRPRERVEMEVDSETMPPPTASGTSPPSGYSTRAKRPRKTADTRAESSTSDGTGSVTRTTPVNGQVEEFWVPLKAM